MASATLDQFRQSVAQRGPSLKGGIVLARRYLDTVAPCLADAACAAAFQGTTFSQDQWAKAYEASDRRYCYRVAEMKYVSDDDARDAVSRAGGASRAARDLVLKDAFEATTGSILDFNCVLTATTKDRDGDLLEAAGAQIDPDMPLLWQHLPLQPIGRLVAVLSQNAKRVIVRCMVADTALGRDAAALIEAKALRISHGFNPLEFEPLDKAARSGEKAGWHVTKYEVLEVSAVSIPSNVQAVITAYSRGKLHDPLMVKWAKAHYDARPAQATSGFDPQQPIQLNVIIGGAETKPADKPAGDKGHKCGCDLTVPVAAGPRPLMPLLAGSWEFTQDALDDSAADYLMRYGMNYGFGRPFMLATYPDHGIVVCPNGYGSDDFDCYQVAWEEGDDGKPVWTGEPVKVEITTQIRERAVAVLKLKRAQTPAPEKQPDGQTNNKPAATAETPAETTNQKGPDMAEKAVEKKMGGYLSAEHHGNLQKGYDLLNDMDNVNGVPDKAAKMAATCKGHIKGALDHLAGGKKPAPGDDDDDDDKSTEALAAKLYARLAAGGKLKPRWAKTLHAVLNEQLETRRRAAVAELVGG